MPLPAATSEPRRGGFAVLGDESAQPSRVLHQPDGADFGHHHTVSATDDPPRVGAVGGQALDTEPLLLVVVAFEPGSTLPSARPLRVPGATVVLPHRLSEVVQRLLVGERGHPVLLVFRQPRPGPFGHPPVQPAVLMFGLQPVQFLQPDSVLELVVLAVHLTGLLPRLLGPGGVGFEFVGSYPVGGRVVGSQTVDVPGQVLLPGVPPSGGPVPRLPGAPGVPGQRFLLGRGQRFLVDPESDDPRDRGWFRVGHG